MKRFKVENIRFVLEWYTPKVDVNNLIKGYGVKDIDELSGLYWDVWNLYITLVDKYGVNTYSQWKLGSYLVELYERLNSKFSFDDFVKIIYLPTDVDGIYSLPDFEEIIGNAKV